jgi:hypothetical protein
MLSFNFTASVAEEQIEPCVVNSNPGWKGPGKNAKCHPYEEGNAEDEAFAKKKLLILLIIIIIARAVQKLSMLSHSLRVNSPVLMELAAM